MAKQFCGEVVIQVKSVQTPSEIFTSVRSVLFSGDPAPPCGLTNAPVLRLPCDDAAPQGSAAQSHDPFNLKAQFGINQAASQQACYLLTEQSIRVYVSRCPLRAAVIRVFPSGGGGWIQMSLGRFGVHGSSQVLSTVLVFYFLFFFRYSVHLICRDTFIVCLQ